MANKSVYNNAFISKPTITSISFGSQCLYVGENAFKDCISLKEINKDNVLEYIGSYAFTDNELTSVTFSKLTKMHNNAFMSCSKLEHISMPNCKNIPNGAFQECISLNDISLDNISTIGDESFKDCTSLDKIRLNECERIGKSAFKGCTSITELSLSVCGEIGSDAFVDCPNLEKVYINNPSTIFCKLGNKNVFCKCDTSSSKCSIKTSFYFKADDCHNYQNDSNWSHYIDNMVLTPGVNQIVYKTSDNTYIDVSKYNNENNEIIAHTYTNYGVISFKKEFTTLNKNIFKDSDKLTFVVIPDSCTHILESAFENCTGLKDIMISNVTNIGKYAFKNCTSLKSFTILDSTEELGEGAFIGCKNIENFNGKGVIFDGKAVMSKNKLICVLPKDGKRIYNLSNMPEIQTLGESCFDGCEKMIRVDIPSTTNVIGYNAFSGCKNLYEIHINNDNFGLTNLGINVFESISDNIREGFKVFVPEKCLEKWGDISNIYPKPTDGSIIYYANNKISESHESINKDCVNGEYYKMSTTNCEVPKSQFANTEATTIILGEAITSINESAFKECKNLEYIYLSDNITHMNNECFYGCENITRIHIPHGNGNAKYGNDIFYKCKKLEEFGTYHEGFVSDDNRCYINQNNLTFFAQGNLSEKEKSYTIPDNIDTINRSAFRASNIKNITLSSNVKTIGEYAFADCKDLLTIDNWDNSVETIASHAFENCTKMNLTSNNSNDNKVTSIGGYAFRNCESLNTLSLEYIRDINESAFENCISLEEIGVKIIESIGANAFKNCEKLTKLVFPKFDNLRDLLEIGESAFENCTQYKGMYDASSNKCMLKFYGDNMGKNCFKNSGIEDLYVEFRNKGLTLHEICDGSFQECKCLKSVDMENNTMLLRIGAYAFKDCENLDELKLPKSISSAAYDDRFIIYNSAFENCKSIKDIILPNYDHFMLFDYCFATKSINTYVHMPYDSKSYFDTSYCDYPFGNPSEKNIPKLFIPESCLNASYVKNETIQNYNASFVEDKNAFEDGLGLFTPIDIDIDIDKGNKLKISTQKRHIRWADTTIKYELYRSYPNPSDKFALIGSSSFDLETKDIIPHDGKTISTISKYISPFEISSDNLEEARYITFTFLTSSGDWKFIQVKNETITL